MHHTPELPLAACVQWGLAPNGPAASKVPAEAQLAEPSHTLQVGASLAWLHIIEPSRLRLLRRTQARALCH